jgi:creatinine amidohydrolase
MRVRFTHGMALVLTIVAGAETPRAQTVAAKGILLEELSWVTARQKLTPDAVVVIALGAQAKEHGPHLRLNNDWLMAEYFKKRVLEQANVVVAPTINYNFYPAFVEYPGSTTLRLETARDVIVDICASLAHHGPKRFYILNTGVSTVRALKPAVELLAKQGILMHFTELGAVTDAVVKAISEQKEGTHADEIETSMMLYIAPSTVDMSLAAKDYPVGSGPLTPDKNKPGRYSPSGVYGDATLASRAKGEIVTEAMLNAILREIETLRAAPLPQSR